jgi:hypothetical protein
MKALKAAERLLEKRIEEINAINVFPVPDGDTGINMFLTLQSATAAGENLATTSVSEVSAKVARGALLGARGNSGVILSQILRGIAKGLEMKECFSSADLAYALCCASETAYRAVAHPMEGTILTVIREASEVAEQQVARGASLKQTMAAVTANAQDTVRRTQDMLPKLTEAGVVDAGGKGLFYIFLGMRNAISRKISRPADCKITVTAGKSVEGNNGYGFDLQFLVEGKDLPLEVMRQKIGDMGESVLVVGDDCLIRVHIHTKEPQAVLDYSATFGALRDINLENMDEQVEQLRQKKIFKEKIRDRYRSDATSLGRREISFPSEI